MKSKIFPYAHLKTWKGGKKIFNKFVDNHFGIYLSRPTPETGYITFLPEDKLAEIIPSEIAAALNNMARDYTENIKKKMKPLGTLNDVSDDITEAEQEDIIRERLRIFFKEHKRRYRETAAECLKRFYYRAWKKK